MILCIKKSALKTAPEVQKDIKLEDLMLKHTKYYDTEEEALNDQYVPLDFSTTIRSMYSNLVVEFPREDKMSYYTNLTHIEKFIHTGLDLVMYLVSIAVMHNIEYKKGFDEVMLEHSQFCPIGIYNPDPDILNPIVYCHVILSDKGAEELKPYLKSDRKFVSIKDIKEVGNIKALLDTILYVKEEDKDESNNNN